MRALHDDALGAAYTIKVSGAVSRTACEAPLSPTSSPLLSARRGRRSRAGSLPCFRARRQLLSRAKRLGRPARATETREPCHSALAGSLRCAKARGPRGTRSVRGPTVTCVIRVSTVNGSASSSCRPGLLQRALRPSRGQPQQRGAAPSLPGPSSCRRTRRRTTTCMPCSRRRGLPPPRPLRRPAPRRPLRRPLAPPRAPPRPGRRRPPPALPPTDLRPGHRRRRPARRPPSRRHR